MVDSNKRIGATTEDASETPVVKRRKTTCSHCRQRKSKCDGAFPQCATCKAYKTPCQYDKPPSLAYVRSLESRIEALQRELDGRKDGETPVTNTRDATKIEHSNNRLSTGPISPLSGDILSPVNSRDHTRRNRGTEETETAQWVSEISTDGNGGVSYHNPTSAIHDPPHDESLRVRRDSFLDNFTRRPPPVRREDNIEREEIRQLLVSNAMHQRRQEALAVEALALRSDIGISKEMMEELLKLHWCWIHPSFLFVYRPAFIRGFPCDMASFTQKSTDSRHISDTLLKVMCAHSSRFLVDAQGGAEQLMGLLTEQAYASLGRLICEPSSVPTIQAFLQQSARETAFGRPSQAWLYSGMASRMAVDLGIHLPNDKLQNYVRSLSHEEVEIRKRAFWSCYTWDKVISLYLGRMPGLSSYDTFPRDPNTIYFFDDSSDTDLWEPYYGPSSNDDTQHLPYFPPREGRIMSTFTNLCKLCIILNDLMLHIYGSPTSSGLSSKEKEISNTSKNAAFLRICNDLRTWWDWLPTDLQLIPGSLPALSPPPHIVSLNLLYHTTYILLHRPFVVGAADLTISAVQRSYQICLAATNSIHDLLQLLVATFGHRHITYLNCYSAYIAATIAVLHYQREVDSGSTTPIEVLGERMGLKFFLGVMQRIGRGMPAMNRSVDIIKGHVHTILEQQKKKQLQSLFPDFDRLEQRVKRAPETPIFNDLDHHQTSVTMERGSTLDMSGGQLFPDDTQPGSFSFSDPILYGPGGLPAFPGQQLADFSLDIDTNMLDPATRAAFMGSNLDPHIQLNHETHDWDYNGYSAGGDFT